MRNSQVTYYFRIIKIKKICKFEYLSNQQKNITRIDKINKLLFTDKQHFILIRCTYIIVFIKLIPFV